jgi:hypothetical protein
MPGFPKISSGTLSQLSPFALRPHHAICIIYCKGLAPWGSPSLRKKTRNCCYGPLLVLELLLNIGSQSIPAALNCNTGCREKDDNNDTGDPQTERHFF